MQVGFIIHVVNTTPYLWPKWPNNIFGYQTEEFGLKLFSMCQASLTYNSTSFDKCMNRVQMYCEIVFLCCHVHFYTTLW